MEVSMEWVVIEREDENIFRNSWWGMNERGGAKCTVRRTPKGETARSTTATIHLSEPSFPHFPILCLFVSPAGAGRSREKNGRITNRMWGDRTTDSLFVGGRVWACVNTNETIGAWQIITVRVSMVFIHTVTRHTTRSCNGTSCANSQANAATTERPVESDRSQNQMVKKILFHFESYSKVVRMSFFLSWSSSLSLSERVMWLAAVDSTKYLLQIRQRTQATTYFLSPTRLLASCGRTRAYCTPKNPAAYSRSRSDLSSTAERGRGNLTGHRSLPIAILSIPSTVCAIPNRSYTQCWADRCAQSMDAFCMYTLFTCVPDAAIPSLLPASLTRTLVSTHRVEHVLRNCDVTISLNAQDTPTPGGASTETSARP